ncbi:hypothetical protein DDE01_17850 [Desulfovibrio desulfuricans]|nr:hypothetical protein DDE01_17850 [Desulfovibrio desulfuricans]
MGLDIINLVCSYVEFVFRSVLCILFMLYVLYIDHILDFIDRLDVRFRLDIPILAWY